MKNQEETSIRRQNPVNLHFNPLVEQTANGTEMSIGHVCQQTTERRMRNSVTLTAPGAIHTFIKLLQNTRISLQFVDGGAVGVIQNMRRNRFAH